MATRMMLEALPDRRRICVMLRADAWTYGEIARFLGAHKEVDHVFLRSVP